MKINLNTGSHVKSSSLVSKDKKFKEDDVNKNLDEQNQSQLDKKIGVK